MTIIDISNSAYMLFMTFFILITLYWWSLMFKLMFYMSDLLKKWLK